MIILLMNVTSGWQIGKFNIGIGGTKLISKNLVLLTRKDVFFSRLVCEHQSPERGVPGG